MKSIERYELFCGEKISKLFLRYLTALVVLFLLPVIFQNGTSANLTIEIILFTGQFSLIGKAIHKVFKSNMEDFDEYFKNFKGAYAVSLIVMLIFTLIYFFVKSILLKLNEKYSISIMDFMFEVEWIFLLYAIMPLSLSVSTNSKTVLLDILLWTLFGIKDLYIPEVTVGLMLSVLLLIPLMAYVSTKIMLSSIKIKCGNTKGTEINDLNENPGFLERIYKSYKIYTGKTLGHLFYLYLIMDAALFLVTFFLTRAGRFTTVTASSQTAVIVASMGIFSAAKCEPSELFHRKCCYLLSIKNRLNVYKDYYFTTYFSLLLTLVVFIALTYIAGGLCHVLPENYILYFCSDISSMLLLFAIVPFFMSSRSAGILMAKIMIISVVFVPVKIFLANFHWVLQFVVAIGAIILMFISNRYWLRRITVMYQEV